MGYSYSINYNGKVYNKSQLLKELNVSETLWNKCVRLVIAYARKNNIEITTDEMFYNLVIEKVIARKQMNKSCKETRDFVCTSEEQKLNKPVYITKYVFYTFKDIREFIGHDAFDYLGYLSFKRSRTTAYSIEDFIAYLYREDESFKLRLLHVTGVIDANLYALASKCMNSYVTAHKHHSCKRGDITTYEKISADDAIKIAYGKMNYDSSKHQITSLLTNRWVVNQYTNKEKS